MAYFYTYLISSLPSLQFGGKPAFSFQGFLDYCQRLIPESDIQILRKVSISGDYPRQNIQPTLKNWHDFDTQLRNELVKIRASLKHLDATKYLRQDKFLDSSILHLAINACRNPSILEAEKMLDQERWRALDGFCFGHYFDLDFLIIYALKLLILERWERVNSADKNKVLEETLS
ncbi:MAG: DUF2764 family protein [Candidatus Omnitrophota bacterium]|nr:DUF2764 family protein [Candidatus Omnitrophota bacterium]